jgi:hypothetical protein
MASKSQLALIDYSSHTVIDTFNLGDGSSISFDQDLLQHTSDVGAIIASSPLN